MRKIQSRLDILRKRQVRMVPRVTMLIALFLILFFGSSKLATIGWANSTTVSIDPDPQGVILGDTATTDVLVENVDDLYGFEFQITFDPAVVEAVQVQPGGFLNPDWILENTIDNDSGTINYALCQRDPSPPKDGNGVLATITWRGKAPGTSPIHFNYVKLGAPGPVPIPADTEDGEITVVAVDLELTKDVDNDSPTEGEQVMFTITVTNTGTLDATGVDVQDTWNPSAALSYHSYSATAGTYAHGSDTGIWTVGGLAMGASATLHITATANADFVNIAEVHACDQTDADSTPNNGDPTEDDQAEVGGTAGPTAVTLSSLTAKSRPEASLAWPWMVGAAALIMSGVLWIKRRK